MKKLNLTKKLLKTKWLILLLITVFLVIFGRTVNIIALTKSATVIAVGIDYEEEKKEFIVTMQSVFVSSSSSGGGSQIRYVLYTDRGSTISQAADRIEQQMGLILSLSHCNIVVLSERAMTLDNMHIIEPLVKSLVLPEQATVISSSNPEELLSLKMATTITVPFYLQTALMENTGSDGIARLTVKDFLAYSCSRGKAVMMPYVEKVKLEDQPLDPNTEAKDYVKLKTDRALVTNQTDSQILNEVHSKAAALYSADKVFGSLNITLDGGAVLQFKVLNKKQKIKVEERTVKVDIDLSVTYLESQYVSDEIPVFASDPIVKAAAAELGKLLTKHLYECYEFSKEQNIDFLQLENYVYQKIGRTLEEDCLNTISFKPNIKITVKESS